jgi:hypothetical protein
MPKQSNQLDKPAPKNAERGLGQRLIKLRYNEDQTIVEFRMFVWRSGRRAKRVFGGGIFEEQDLYCIAAALSELARDHAAEAQLIDLRN